MIREGVKIDFFSPLSFVFQKWGFIIQKGCMAHDGLKGICFFCVCAKGAERVSLPLEGCSLSTGRGSMRTGRGRIDRGRVINIPGNLGKGFRGEPGEG